MKPDETKQPKRLSKRQAKREAEIQEARHNREVRERNAARELALKQNPDVICLLKRKKKGLLRIVFSRFGISVVLLLLQLLLVGAFLIVSNEDDTGWLQLALAVFTFFMFIHLFKSDMSSSAKLTWFFLMTMFPIPVSIMLWYTERDAGHSRLRNRLRDMIQQTKDKLPQDEAVIQMPEVIASGTDALSRYLHLSGCFPLYHNTQVTFFPLGENKFATMQEELKKAEKFIFMEYFIVGEGLMWGSILKILA